MVNIQKILAVMLVIVIAAGLYACSESGVEQTTGPVTYQVTVTDEAGNPIAGAGVQLCKDSCIPGVTDEKGVVTFTAPRDDYKVAFMKVPEGYTADAEEFLFEEGSFEMTIVLKLIS